MALLYNYVCIYIYIYMYIYIYNIDQLKDGSGTALESTHLLRIRTSEHPYPYGSEPGPQVGGSKRRLRNQPTVAGSPPPPFRRPSSSV